MISLFHFLKDPCINHWYKATTTELIVQVVGIDFYNVNYRTKANLQIPSVFLTMEKKIFLEYFRPI